MCASEIKACMSSLHLINLLTEQTFDASFVFLIFVEFFFLSVKNEGLTNTQAECTLNTTYMHDNFRWWNLF